MFKEIATKEAGGFDIIPTRFVKMSVHVFYIRPLITGCCKVFSLIKHQLLCICAVIKLLLKNETSDFRPVSVLAKSFENAR